MHTTATARSKVLSRSLHSSAAAQIRSAILFGVPRLSSSLACEQQCQAQQRLLQRQQTAAVPVQQPERADVRVASSASELSSSSSSEGSFINALRPAAFKRYPIAGDGSCMFRACVQGHHHAQHGHSMPSNEEYSEALQLRKAVVKALQDNREEMEPFLPGIADDFDAYLRTMSQPGTWGGEPELLMVSRVLKRPICVYQPTWSGPQHIVTYGEDLLKAAQPMHLLWSGAHYDLLLPQTTSRL